MEDMNVTAASSLTHKVFTEGNETTMNHSHSLKKNDFSLFINCFLSPCLMVIGIIGNILTVKIFRGKKSASSIFITNLAVSDTLLLSFRLIHNIYIIAFNVFPFVVGRIPIRSASWLWIADLPKRIGKLIIITIMSERAFAVYCPLRLKQVWTRKSAVYLLVMSLILVLITGLPPYIDALYFGIIYTQSNSAGGNILQEGEVYRRRVTEWMHMLQFVNKLILDFVPLVMIFILCVTTSVGLKVRMSAKSLKLSDFQMIRRRQKERRINVTLLAMSSLSFLFCSPFDICGVLVQFKVYRIFDVPLEVTDSFLLLLNVNSVVNFIIYGICDKSLRKEYINQFKCCKRKEIERKIAKHRIHYPCQKDSSTNASSGAKRF